MRVAVLHQAETGRSPRQILREWIRDYIEDKDEIRTEDLVPLAYAKFAQDTEFAEAMLRDGIATLVPIIANEVWGSARRLVPVAGGAVSRERLEDMSKNKFARMFENAGNGRHMSLLAMRKPNLQVAIEERTRDVEGRQRHLAFLVDVEANLPNAKVTVGDRFGVEELNKIWRKHFTD